MNLRIGVTVAMSAIAVAFAEEKRYLDYARVQADALLEHGKDRYGEVVSDLWASVMSIDDLSVPRAGIPPTPGVRPHDRAVGGSNPYHEVDTILSLDLLTAILGDERYRKAADRYIELVFELTQNSETGLLGWGEHIYYDFYRDRVWAGPSETEKPHIYAMMQMPHELLERTPPWTRFAEVNPEGVQKAIEGIIYHFNGPDPKTYLFNRHAYWHKPERQTTIMPWIKHTALYAYSWVFHHRETGNEQLRRWGYDIGSLYHRHRDERTGLVFGTLVHHDVGVGKSCALNSAGYYAYWLYKTYELSGDERYRTMALGAIDSYLKYGDLGEGKYWDAIEIDGTPVEGKPLASVWKEGYSSFTLPSFGRVLSYLAKGEPAADYGIRAASIFEYTLKEGIPDRFNALQISESIMFCLDLHHLDPRSEYLDRAQELAWIAVERLWKEPMFSRQTGEGIYESKLGSSSLMLAFIRLHLIEMKRGDLLAETDWSF